MTDGIDILTLIYARFNARDIEGVLAVLDDDVAWANGMHGGHVHGRDAVRAYWTQQWRVVDPRVEPLDFRKDEDGAVVVTVRQSIRDLEVNPIQEQAHGLTDRTVEHAFYVRNGKVTRFDIRDMSTSA